MTKEEAEALVEAAKTRLLTKEELATVAKSAEETPAFSSEADWRSGRSNTPVCIITGMIAGFGEMNDRNDPGGIRRQNVRNLVTQEFCAELGRIIYGWKRKPEEPMKEVPSASTPRSSVTPRPISREMKREWMRRRGNLDDIFLFDWQKRKVQEGLDKEAQAWKERWSGKISL